MAGSGIPISTNGQKPPEPAAPKKPLVYGGDFAADVPKQSTGSFLFDRMLGLNGIDETFQVCLSTKTEMTRRRFLESSVALAERLRESGVGKGDCVFLVGNNSLNINVALVGVLFLAAVPFPLSHRTKLDDLLRILQSVKPKYLGCEERYLYSLQKILSVDSDFDTSKTFPLDPGMNGFEGYIRGRGVQMENFKPTDVENPSEETAVALKPLTEGEFGRVVGVTHENLNSMIASHEQVEDGLQQKVRLMVQKVFWMSGLCDLITSCAFGSKLIIMRRFQDENFLRAIHDYKVTETMLFTTTWWKMFKLDLPSNLEAKCCVKGYAINGSVPQILKDGMKEKFGINLVPTYVRTEIAGFFVRSDCSEEHPKCVGKLFPGVYGKVLSLKTSEKLGPEKKGEVCLKGPIVTKGYLNNKKANKNLIDKEGWLLTGLYGFYKENGEFFIIDNIDYQIKYKDTRISPVKLEGIIKGLKTVADVYVGGIQHPSDGEHPIALVSLQKGSKLTDVDIIAAVNERVTDEEKLRAGVIFVSKIPRFRDTGSINRELLKRILSKYRVKLKTEEVKEEVDGDRKS